MLNQNGGHSYATKHIPAVHAGDSCCWRRAYSLSHLVYFRQRADADSDLWGVALWQRLLHLGVGAQHDGF